MNDTIKPIRLIKTPKLLCMAYHVRENAFMVEFAQDKKAPKDHIDLLKMVDNLHTGRFWEAFFEEYPKYKTGYELGIRYNKDTSLISVEIKPQTADEKKLDEVIADLDFNVEGIA